MLQHGMKWLPRGSWFVGIGLGLVVAIPRGAVAGEDAAGSPAAERVVTEKPDEDAEAVAEMLQDPQDGPALKKKAREARKAARAERQKRAPAAEEPAREEAIAGQEVPPPVFGYGPWGWYPYWPIPQTRRYRDYPPSITHVPRLGLQYNYPWAYQMGIRVPDDSNPLWHPPNLGPFVGVVQMAKEQALLEAEATAGVSEAAVTLLQAGKYREAGRVLAAAFKVSTDPEFPLLLTEAFVGLEKPDHAELLLRHALEEPSALKFLPDDIASHFPDKDVFTAKVEAVLDGGRNTLLAAYLLVHSDEPSRGLDLLGKMASDEPHDKAAAQLYRHYLRRLFREK